MDEEILSPNQLSEGVEDDSMPFGEQPVQGFAFGGIANPGQRAFLRASDKSYLDARQAELDKFEADRLGYNDALTKWQNEVYNPYKSQVDAFNAAAQKYNEEVHNPYQARVNEFNAAAQKYNEEVYNPYQSQFDAYQRAVDEWNAGPRTTDYAGPQAPTLSRTFDLTQPEAPAAFSMSMPTAPKDFDMVAPTLPFKEEEVKAYQQAAAARSQRDAASRAAAIDVVSNPDKYNFGSLSIADRFMAEGGPVERDKSAMSVTDFIAAAGRGGDTELAYLSPSARDMLKSMGGAGTVNPLTGLPEYKGGVLGQVKRAIFGGGDSPPPPPEPPPPPPPPQEPVSVNPFTGSPVTNGSGTPGFKGGYNGQGMNFGTAWDPAALDAFLNQNKTAADAKAAADAQAEADARARIVAPTMGQPAPSGGNTWNSPTEPPPTEGMRPEPAPSDGIVDAQVIVYGPDGTMYSSPRAAREAGVTNYTMERPAPKVQDIRAIPIPTLGSAIAKKEPFGAGTIDFLKAQGPGSAKTIDVGPGFKALDPTYLKTISKYIPGADKKPGEEEPGITKPKPGGGLEIVNPGVVMPDFSGRGVGAIGRGSVQPYTPPPGPVFGVSNPKNPALSADSYFALSGKPSTGLAPGTTALAPLDLPLAGGMNTMRAIGENKNLTPTMLGGEENAGIMYDRLGNAIFTPMMPKPIRTFAKGGLTDVNEYNLSDDTEEDYPINTDPLGSAQKMMSDLSSLGQTQTSYSQSPNKISVKRVSRAPISDDTGTAKGMAMEYESLTSSKDKKTKAKDTDSAKSQLEAMAKAYKLKASEAENMSRGLMRSTFNAPTLEKLLLNKNTLAKKRFADGGEAKKEMKEQGLWGVKDYATETSARMFPKQKGNDDQRDAARHMLAAAIVSRKLGPDMAEFLGKAHERLSSPASFFSMLGAGEPRYDYNVDVHNNKLGIDLGSRAKDQAELEKMVEDLAKKSVNKQEEGRPWTVSREQLKEIVAQNKKRLETPPEYRAEGSPEEGEGYVKPSNPMSGKAATQARLRAEIAERARVASARERLANTPVLDEAGGETTDEFIKRTTGLDAAMDEKRGTFLPMPVKRNGKTEFLAPSILKDAMLPYNLSSQALTTKRFDPQKVPEAAMNVSLAGLATGKRPANSVGMAARPEGTSLYIGAQDDYMNYPANVLRNAFNDLQWRDMEENPGGEARKALMEAFWNNKARNYFVKQYGTESDPVYKAIVNQQIKSPKLKKSFPNYVLDQLPVGKTRVNEETGESRFFPKYPEASDAMRNTYDRLTNIEAAVPVTNPRDVMHLEHTYVNSTEGDRLLEEIKNKEIDKMIAQGTPVSQANPNPSFITRSFTSPETIVGPDSARGLLERYERATGTTIGNPSVNTGVVEPNVLEPQLKRAFETGETVYSASSPDSTIGGLFNPNTINNFLMTVPERELKNIRFEDAVKGGAKLRLKEFERETLAEDIRAGKRVDDKFFSEGVSQPLLSYDNGPYEGFAWKRIEDPESTVPEGAYVGHSVGGYAKGGAYGPHATQEFIEGKRQVYTLRDKRNRPVNTIEVRLGTYDLPQVTQIKGNGRLTGNTAPQAYDVAVLDFLQNYINPVRIGEEDRFLTPILRSYKETLEQTSGQREREAANAANLVRQGYRDNAANLADQHNPRPNLQAAIDWLRNLGGAGRQEPE